ncbi:MAG: trypsin-like peptidase domain-containing protein [Chloroflexota bacterium]
MSTLTNLSDSLASAVEKASASTLLVDGRKRYPASGIAYAPDLVLTADHVVTRDNEVRVLTPDGQTLPASLAGRDPGTDLALLRLNENALQPASLAKTDAKVGQLVLALGRPTPAGVQASWGIVTAIGGRVRTPRGGLLDEYLQTEATPYPGFSGGPLVDGEGATLGLNTSGLTPGSAITLPVKFAWRIAESLAKHGSVKRGYLGVRTHVVEIPDDARQALKRDQSTGLLVAWLDNGGPAQTSGILVGDILVAVAGQSVTDPDDLFVALDSGTVGKPVAVEILRGGQPKTLNVTAGERK